MGIVIKAKISLSDVPLHTGQLWKAADEMMDIAKDGSIEPDYVGEHLKGGSDHRFMIERSPNGGTRIVIADERWMKHNQGYFKHEIVQPPPFTRREG